MLIVQALSPLTEYFLISFFVSGVEQKGVETTVEVFLLDELS